MNCNRDSRLDSKQISMLRYRTLARKTDTERRLVHTLAHAIRVVSIASICCLSIPILTRPHSSRTARLTKARPAQAVTSPISRSWRGSREARAATRARADGGERAPLGGAAEAGAAATGMRNDGERSAMSRELAAKRRSGSNRVTGTGGAGWPAGRRRSRRDAGGREQRLERVSWRACRSGHC